MASSVIPKGLKLNLILLGKTGEGKSSTGNLILGRKAFSTSDGKKSCTSHPKLSSSIRHDGITVNIVDTPGLQEKKAKTKETIDKITHAFSLCRNGFDALVFVINYAGIFTEECSKTLRILKGMFGEKFLDHCVIVVTHGSLFDINSKDKSFEEWCETQGDLELDNLFQQCHNRVVLFYNNIKLNKTTNHPLDPEDAQRQITCVEKLISIVQQMPTRYTNDYFEACVVARETIAIEEDLPELTNSIQNKLSFLIGSYREALNDIGNESNIDVTVLLYKANKLVEKIENAERGTGVLEKLRDKAVDIQCKIEMLSNVNEQKQNLIKQMSDDTEVLKDKPNKHITKAKYVTRLTGSLLLGGLLALDRKFAIGGIFASHVGIGFAIIKYEKDKEKHVKYDTAHKRLEENRETLLQLNAYIRNLRTPSTLKFPNYFNAPST